MQGLLRYLRIFDIPALLGLEYGTALALIIVLIGILGSAYAILGGLRAVAVSDTLNGAGLLVVGDRGRMAGFTGAGRGQCPSGPDSFC
jgi:SSS family solute:Na+ symporter